MEKNEKIRSGLEMREMRKRALENICREATFGSPELLALNDLRTFLLAESAVSQNIDNHIHLQNGELETAKIIANLDLQQTKNQINDRMVSVNGYSQYIWRVHKHVIDFMDVYDHLDNRMFYSGRYIEAATIIGREIAYIVGSQLF